MRLAWKIAAFLVVVVGGKGVEEGLRGHEG